MSLERLANRISRHRFRYRIVAVALLSQAVLFWISSGLRQPKDVVRLQTAYNAADFHLILAAWTPMEFNRYLSHYLVDLFHPLFYGLALASLIHWLWPSRHHGWMWRGFFLAPLVAGVLDEVENFCDLVIILSQTRNFDWLIPIGAIASTAKWAFCGFSAIVIISLFLARKLGVNRHNDETEINT